MCREDIPHHQQCTTNNFIKLHVHNCKYNDRTKSLYINVSQEHVYRDHSVATYSIGKLLCTDFVVTIQLQTCKFLLNVKHANYVTAWHM